MQQGPIRKAVAGAADPLDRLAREPSGVSADSAEKACSWAAPGSPPSPPPCGLGALVDSQWRRMQISPTRAPHSCAASHMALWPVPLSRLVQRPILSPQNQQRPVEEALVSGPRREHLYPGPVVCRSTGWGGGAQGCVRRALSAEAEGGLAVCGSPWVGEPWGRAIRPAAWGAALLMELCTRQSGGSDVAIGRGGTSPLQEQRPGLVTSCPRRSWKCSRCELGNVFYFRSLVCITCC